MLIALLHVFFFFNDTATTEIYTLSYTTLFRSLSFWPFSLNWMPGPMLTLSVMLVVRIASASAFGSLERRSEEHTSELQSHHDLVCRLLLEKKNNAQQRSKYRHATQSRAVDNCT